MPTTALQLDNLRKSAPDPEQSFYSELVRQILRQLVYTKFISNNRLSLYMW